jgi:hypothetical protein
LDQRELEGFCRRIDPLAFVRLHRRFTAQDQTAEAQKAVERMNLFKASVHETGTNIPPHLLTFEGMPSVIDTGASAGLTPFRDDFIEYKECSIPVKDISKMNYVSGVGIVLQKHIATNGDVLFVPSIAYHLKTAEIRLFSPQTYHGRWGGHTVIDGDGCTIHLPQQDDYHLRHDIFVPIDRRGSNLPICFDISCTAKERKEYAPHFRAMIARHALNFESWSFVDVDDFEYEFAHYSQMMMMGSTDVDSAQNTNLDGPQIRSFCFGTGSSASIWNECRSLCAPCRLLIRTADRP